MIDLDSHQVWRAGQPVELTATEFRLLDFLLTHPRQVLSKTQILDEVWEDSFAGDSNIVEIYISYLRKKIDCFDPPPHPHRPRRRLLPAGTQPMTLRRAPGGDHGRAGRPRALGGRRLHAALARDRTCSAGSTRSSTRRAHQIVVVGDPGGAPRVHGDALVTIGSRVSPDIYVEIIDPNGHVAVVKPSVSGSTADPAPRLPAPRPGDDRHPTSTAPRIADQPYQPDSAAQTVHSVVPGTDPEYRMEATSLPGATLVVATRLDTVNATLELAAHHRDRPVGRPAPRPAGPDHRADPARAASARGHEHGGGRHRGGRPDPTGAPDRGQQRGRPARRALNGMLTQIESAFAQRARSEDHLRSFLADASHELRTPLTSIQGYAELLRKDALADDASRDRALSRIEKEAARMGALVGDLAVLAREGEGPEPTRYQVDLAAVAAEAVDRRTRPRPNPADRADAPPRGAGRRRRRPARPDGPQPSCATRSPTRRRAPRSRSRLRSEATGSCSGCATTVRA